MGIQGGGRFLVVFWAGIHTAMQQYLRIKQGTFFKNSGMSLQDPIVSNVSLG